MNARTLKRRGFEFTGGYLSKGERIDATNISTGETVYTVTLDGAEIGRTAETALLRGRAIVRFTPATWLADEIGRFFAETLDDVAIRLRNELLARGF